MSFSGYILFAAVAAVKPPALFPMMMASYTDLSATSCFSMVPTSSSRSFFLKSHGVTLDRETVNSTKIRGYYNTIKNFIFTISSKSRKEKRDCHFMLSSRHVNL